jgi:hypothetical protein
MESPFEMKNRLAEGSASRDNKELHSGDRDLCRFVNRPVNQNIKIAKVGLS